MGAVLPVLWTVLGVNSSLFDALTGCGVGAVSARELALTRVGSGSVTVLNLVGTFLDGRMVSQAIAGTYARIFEPEGASWTSSELAGLVQSGVLVSGGEELVHVCILGADRMSSQVGDRLLKWVEQPDSGRAFWLVLDLDGKLSSTIRGRLTGWVDVQEAEYSEAVDALVARDVDRLSAERAMGLAGGDLALAGSIVERDLFETAQRVAEFDPFSSWKVQEADLFIGRVCSLFSPKSWDSGLVAWTSVSVEQRSLARNFLLRWAADSRVVLTGVAELRVAESCLGALNDFRSMVRANVMPLHAMSVFAQPGLR